jgi:hypothetical protein
MPLHPGLSPGASIHSEFILDSSLTHRGPFTATTAIIGGGVLIVGIYMVAWIAAVFGVALLGEATRRAGEVLGGRVAAWSVVLVVMGFLVGYAGSILASGS